jgi:hypothetical protein
VEDGEAQLLSTGARCLFTTVKQLVALKVSLSV